MSYNLSVKRYSNLRGHCIRLYVAAAKKHAHSANESREAGDPSVKYLQWDKSLFDVVLFQFVKRFKIGKIVQKPKGNRESWNKKEIDLENCIHELKLFYPNSVTFLNENLWFLFKRDFHLCTC